MCCVDWQLTVYTGRRRCVVYLPACLSYRGHLPGPLAEPPPRTGRDVIKGVGLHCIRGGLPLPHKQARQVSQTSLTCTSTQLSPCSEHLVRCGSSAVVLGSAVRG